MAMEQAGGVNVSRRGLFRLSGSVVCAIGLGLLASSERGICPERAVADELSVNDAGEYTYTPDDVLTLDDLPPEIQTMAASADVEVVNLGGEDRYETVAKEALYAFPSGCSTAVVASGAGYADSIAAAGLAGALGCPILLTNTTYVPDVTSSALRSLGVKNIVLLGSESVANSSVMSSLRGFGSVERVWGADRYATQMAIYRYGSSRGLWTGDTVIVAAATGFADALSASPVSYALKAPVFFCDSSRTLPSEQRGVLSNELTSAKNFLLLGSTSVTSDSVLSYLKGLASARGGTAVRLGGGLRYDTSMAIAEYAVKNLGFKWDGVAFASGQGPYDALGGGVVQGKEKSVLLLADGSNYSSVNVIVRNGGSVSTTLKFFGSTVVVPADVRAKICTALHVPYLSNTSFKTYGISRARMAQLQVNRNEGNGYTYNDFYAALNPDQYEYGTSSFYQFALLTDGYSGMTSTNIDSYVANNCTYQESAYGRSSALRGLGSAFVEAAQTYGVNEVYLLAHAIWESAWGCSDLATGWKPDADGKVTVNGVDYPYYKNTTYYNFYGIGAVDSNALSGGRTLAVKEGWTSPRAAVLGAASWISANYLRYSAGAQNTLYLMKWDVEGAAKTGSAWHEYCTGLGTWCTGIASVMDRCYKSAGWSFGQSLKFSVPVYAS